MFDDGELHTPASTEVRTVNSLRFEISRSQSGGYGRRNSYSNINDHFGEDKEHRAQPRSVPNSPYKTQHQHLEGRDDTQEGIAVTVPVQQRSHSDTGLGQGEWDAHLEQGLAGSSSQPQKPPSRTAPGWAQSLEPVTKQATQSRPPQKEETFPWQPQALEMEPRLAHSDPTVPKLQNLPTVANEARNAVSWNQYAKQKLTPDPPAVPQSLHPIASGLLPFSICLQNQYLFCYTSIANLHPVATCVGLCHK